jgi:hypothetical protein
VQAGGSLAQSTMPWLESIDAAPYLKSTTDMEKVGDPSNEHFRND